MTWIGTLGAIILGLGLTLGSQPLLAADGASKAEPGAEWQRPVEERYTNAVERLGLRPEQTLPFQEALARHRQAQRDTAEAYPAGRGDWKERRQAMMANTRAFKAELGKILTPEQMEIFEAWRAEERQAQRASK